MEAHTYWCGANENPRTHANLWSIDLKNILVMIILFLMTSCAAFKDTIAVGACGTVDYRVTFMGTPLIGIQAERECVEEDETL